MEDIYLDGTYEKLNPTWHEEDAPWKARQIEMILSHNCVSIHTVCEVGCGAGGILVELSKVHPEARFTGYEISPQAFAMAQPKASANVEFYMKDVFEESGDRFDVALVIDVVEHVDDYLGFLRNIRGVARLKVLHIPLDLSVQSVFRLSPIVRLRRDVGHIHSFMKESALAALGDCGYRIIDWRYTASRLELPHQARSSHLMAMPRRLLHAWNPDFAVRLLGGYSLLVLAE